VLVLECGDARTLTPVPAIDGKEFSRPMTLNVTAQQVLIAAFDPMLRKKRDAA